MQLLGDANQRAAQHHPLRPARERHHRDGRVGPIAALEQLRDDGVDPVGGQVQDQGGARLAQRGKVLPSGMAVDSVATRLSVTVCATPGTVSSARAPRPRRMPAPGDDLVADPELFEPAALLGDGAVERGSPECSRATSWPAASASASSPMICSRVRGPVSTTRAPGGHSASRSFGMMEFGEQADGAALQQPLAPHGDQVGGARSGPMK